MKLKMYVTLFACLVSFKAIAANAEELGSMRFRTGKTRFYPADYTYPRQDTPYNGHFPEVTLKAKSTSPAFEFVEKANPNNGAFLGYELTFIRDRGAYTCKLMEPVNFPGH